MQIDADGMIRVDLEWTIEGTRKAGNRSGKLYGLHAGEVASARQMLKREARRGDTITVRTI